jgi:hypothetical protein
MNLERKPNRSRNKIKQGRSKRDMKMYLANDWQLKKKHPRIFLLK